jgi:HEPN domain-containing protein
MAESIPEQWADRARYDLESARAMLDSGRIFYVLFCCQQAVEKALKAVIIARTGKLAPRIHSLPRLAELAGLPADDKTRLDFMAQLSAFYFQSRYPGESEPPSQTADHEQAADALRSAEETVGWLLSMIE